MLNDMYNLRVIHYADGDHVRIYKNPVIAKDLKEVDYDGVIVEHHRGEQRVYNPFTDEWEMMVVKEEKEKTEFDNERSRASSMNRTINAIYSIARANVWQYFFTMTFNSEKIDRYDYDKCVKSMSTWLRHSRERYAPDMKYLIVPEKHEDGAWHFHGLFSDIGSIPLVDSGHRDKNGRIIYNIGSYKLGWTTVTEISDNGRSCSYLVKYINKDLCDFSFGRKRYWASRNVLRAEEEHFCLDSDFLAKLFELKPDDKVFLARLRYIAGRGEIGY